MTKQSSDESTRDAWRALKLGGGSSEFSLATIRLPLDAGFGPVRVALGENGELRLLIPTETGRRLPEGLSGAGVRASVRPVRCWRRTSFVYRSGMRSTGTEGSLSVTLG